MSNIQQLREAVCAANLELVARGLVTYTWGNVSGIDREADVVAIKPSGVEYAQLTPAKIVLLRLDGTPAEPGLRPSSDTPTHLELYRAFPSLGGIAHTHSPHAVIFAMAGRPLPCFNTTHADHFNGEVPATRPLTAAEVAGAYEANTGRVIAECFAGQEPLDIPAVLVPGHGPFTWGADPAAAVKNSMVLEQCCRMALGALQLNPDLEPLPEFLLARHFQRKHGPGAYYGQPG